MKQILSRLLVFLMISTAFITEINAQLTINAQYRNRFEIRDGYKAIVEAGTGPAVLISQRTRLTLQYENEFLKLRFTPQDIRLWGDEDLATSTGVFGNYASLDLFEGYIEIRPIKPLWLSIGRQQLIYDNQRLLSARNWNQAGIAYDAMVAKLQLNGWNVHLAGSWNTLLESLINNIYPSSRIKSLNYLWVNKKLNEGLCLSLLHIASGKTETDSTNKIHFRQTSGLYIKYAINKFSIWGNAYYQYGRNNGSNKVSAYLIDADAGYKLGKFRPGLGISYLSGNNTVGADQTVDRLFDVLYGARHKYFGYMDYFRDFPNNTREGGLADLYFYLEYQVCPTLIIRNIGHYFWLARTNPNTPADKNLGYENDLILKYTFRSWGALESGYAFIAPTQSLKELNGIDSEKFPQFFYLQLTITPSLFTHQSGN